MGPTEIGPTRYIDVDQHPHIGLSTLTYLMDGEIMHADSIGTLQKISPGSVNWMVAGRGVTHTERTPQEQRDGRRIKMHGYQIWVALPQELEEIEPSFHHIRAEELPRWEEAGAQFVLVAGEGYGRKSPVPVHSPLFMVEIKTSEDFALDIAGQLAGEVGIVIVEGEIQACDNQISKGNMLVSKVENSCKIDIKANSHLLLFGGEAFPEKRYIHWNFVSSSKEKLEEAKRKWMNKEFFPVPNDNSYVRLPGT
jgi:redox-sensitive bicupin YhaK (pirin superfamily)